jgi:hypothetical protein
VAGNSAPREENKNGEPDRAERAKRLTQKDFDLDPSQFPKSTQHHD